MVRIGSTTGGWAAAVVSAAVVSAAVRIPAIVGVAATVVASVVTVVGSAAATRGAQCDPGNEES